MSECHCQMPVKNEELQPQKIIFTWRDYFKVLFAWLYNYRRTFSLAPGLYYTGAAYVVTAPLLVTCNYHLTVFTLWRILRKRQIRLLVVDTRGINVWCSSGKGRFSAAEIIKQLARYKKNQLTNEEKLTLILPKLSLSGVSLSELKKLQIIPRIGPIYAKELPVYLDEQPWKDRKTDVYRFNLADRLFTLGPALVQFLFYGIFIFLGLFIWNYFFPTGIHWQIFPIMASIAFFYVILFPLLPTKKFAIKGLTLFGLMGAGFILYDLLFRQGAFDFLRMLFYLTFLAGANLFYALAYTGNSGVSNYSLVKREIGTFLPLTFLCFLGALIFIILKGIIV